MVMREVPSGRPERPQASVALGRANIRAVLCALAAVLLAQVFPVIALVVAAFGLRFAFQARGYRVDVENFRGVASLLAALVCAGVIVHELPGWVQLLWLMGWGPS